MSKKKHKVLSCTIPLDSAFSHILFNLAAQGYSYIKISYSGSGDSGGIDEMYAILRGGVDDKDDTDLPVEKSKAKIATLEKELYERIEEEVYEKILESVSDWYNNDGGGGVLFISTEDCKYKGDHYVNIINEEHENLDGVIGD